MKKLKKLFSLFGPGFITGASDDDPSGIGTYAQTGAQFGYMQLWTSLYGLPFMTTVQEICGRIGIVTGKGISGVLRKHYPRPILYSIVLLLFLANTVNIGADVGAMAATVELLFKGHIVFWLVGISLLIVVFEIVVPYRIYVRVLKYLALSLFAYVIGVFLIRQQWQEIALSTLVPHVFFTKEYLLNIVAIFGTTISPYLFFWQAGEEVEEEVAHDKLLSMGRGIPHISKRDIKKMRADTIIGMFFSQLVMFFIIVTTASSLHTHGITSIETADQAAQALRPLAGDYAFILFAAGIIGTGLLAVPILAGSASYAISEAFSWKEGLYRKLKDAYKFYGIIAIATTVGLIINLTPLKPFQLLYYAAVLNGIIAPPLLFLIMRISNNEKIMGKYTNSLFTNLIGWAITLWMGITAVLLLWTLVTNI